ncbi:MAG: thiamine phosphate synthase [Phycisphaerales bacterium]
MDPAFRILDANLNRAREGLRVLEDIARFALDDASVITQFKIIRHALRSVADAADPGGGRLRLLASRDTPADVGTQISTPAESARSNLHDLASAAAARTSEALRVIEETAKLLAPASARGIEQARYHLYELEKRLLLALATGRARQWRLCILLTESLCTHHPWLEVARRAIAGGADCLQLREKDLDSAELLRRADQLIALARPHGVSVIVNDRADIALAANADGVHLGQHDLPVAAVRALAGARLLVGVSTHNLDEARRALNDGADYAGVGAMFTTATKPRETSGPAYLRAFLDFVADKRPLPHLVIGGITSANLSQLAAAGCRGVAVSLVVCSASDPAAVCASLREEIAASSPA